MSYTKDPTTLAERELDSAGAYSDFDALNAVLDAIRPLDVDSRRRVLGAVGALLGMAPSGHSASVSRQTIDNALAETSDFSTDRTQSPKDFLFEKRPQTDVDRIACLAYYLTHYRDTRHFKTLDLSKLNTEAAQLKLTNAARAVDNAAKAGLLVQASKGSKQLSAIGEQYVEALPDRSAARAAVADSRPRRRSRKGVRNSGTTG